ncbi:MAG: polysaccharide pyruvyl transferase family protein, partial [Brevinema sp.]
YLLREFGGIYLDADIEVVDGRKFNKIIEELENSSEYDSIVGIEHADLGYTAHSMACKPQAEMALFMCDIYENMGKLYHWKTQFIAPALLSLYFYDKGSQKTPVGTVMNTSPQIFSKVKVYPQDFFSPLSYGIPIKIKRVTENTCLCHHFGATWVNKDHQAFSNQKNMIKRRKMLRDYQNEKLNWKSKTANLMKKVSYTVRRILGIKRIINEISILQKQIQEQKQIQKQIQIQIQIQISNQQRQINIFERIFSANTNTSKNQIFYLNSPEHSNLGDQAIAAASIDLLKILFPNYVLIEITYNDWLTNRDTILPFINKKDLIFLHGGGNMGNIWYNEEEIRQNIIASLPDNKIISLPQSITFTEDEFGKKALENSRKIYNAHKNLTIMTRDQISFERSKIYFPKVHHILSPDSVFFWEDEMLERYNNQQDRTGLFFAIRNDKEKISNPLLFDSIKDLCQKKEILYTIGDTVIIKDDSIYAHDRKYFIFQLLDQFASARLIVTDRLHGMIFAMLTSTPCIVFPSFDHKIKESQKWVEHLEWIKFNPSIDEIEKMINDYVVHQKTVNHPKILSECILKIYREMLVQ